MNMEKNQWLYSISLLIGLFLLSACQDRGLANALSLAKDNRTELEKVLEHYQGDKPKYEAASFLISNMPGHSRRDSLAVRQLQPYYDKCCEIAETHGWQRTAAWRDEANAYWKEMGPKALSSIDNAKADVRVLKADWLIREIDLSFKAWQENAYSRSIDFDSFCRYILPYRIHNGLCADDSRSLFYQKHAGWFADHKVDFRTRVDSLLYQYKHLVHSDFVAMSLPLLSFGVFEQMKKGLCDDRCKFNVALLSSLGMPVAQDFVPAWGNRSSGHSWNVIVLNGQSYPFEAFWDEDRWKYNRIYNNESLDLKWGKFRLPKVFRNTYEAHLEGPLGDKQVAPRNIPSLFQNPWIKDVSDQYFQGIDVDLEITRKIPEGATYCYLCVFDHKGWIPVQWGEIEASSRVTFQKMGKDIIYLPAFYQNGIITPAADPFLLDNDGKCTAFSVSGGQQCITSRQAKPFLDEKEIATEKRWLVGMELQGCEHPASTGEKLYEWTDTLDMWNNRVTLSPSRPYRYYRLVPASDSIALCELTFRTLRETGWVDVLPVTVSGCVVGVNTGEKIEMMSDHLSATGFKGILGGKRGEGVLFDLGSPCLLREIAFTPYSVAGVTKGKDYELFYWDDRWVSVGKVTGEDDRATFERVPTGTIYWMKVGLSEQIFSYDNGIIEWR